MELVELWKPVKGFENIYLISNKGRLMSRRRGKWRLMSNINSKGDYFAIILRHGDKVWHTRIHRLVYEAFIGEIPEGKRYHIHHIDHNKQNNCYLNLELVDAKTHVNKHLSDGSRMCEAMNNYNRFIRPRSIGMYSIQTGELLGVFPNAQEAMRATGVCARNILQVAEKTPYNNKGFYRKQAGGFRWQFVD